MTTPVIKLDKVTKTFQQQKHSEPDTIFTALDAISLTVNKGEVVGLIGRNGAGKSTLLRILAGTSMPTSGNVDIRGKVLAILNIGTGLCDEKSGVENVYHMAALYQVPRPIVEDIFNPVIEFADLGEAIHNPVRTYSTGMKMRLAFSILTYLPFEVLLIDEALSVGDASFSLKCRHRLRSLCCADKTVIIVSHGMSAIKELCDRTIWLDQGRIIKEGHPFEITEQYRASLIKDLSNDLEVRFARRKEKKESLKELEIKDCKILCKESNQDLTVALVGQTIRILISLENFNVFDGSISIAIIRADGIDIFEVEEPLQITPGPHIICFEFPDLRLGRFVYEARVKIVSSYGKSEYAKVFAVYDDHHSYNSSYYPILEWQKVS
jgi:ABC-type polysaccharide/polyol phosphate transport system ATPase subunit